jgi:hypothetical protein
MRAYEGPPSPTVDPEVPAISTPAAIAVLVSDLEDPAQGRDRLLTLANLGYLYSDLRPTLLHLPDYSPLSNPIARRALGHSRPHTLGYCIMHHMLHHIICSPAGRGRQ